MDSKVDRSIFIDRNVRFPKKPKLVEDLTIFPMPDGLGIMFNGAWSPVIFRGENVAMTLPWLIANIDGKHSVEELLACPENICAADVARLLKMLLEKSLLREGDTAATLNQPPESIDPSLKRQMLFWGRKIGVTRINGSGDAVQQKLRQASLAILGDGSMGASLCDILYRSGIINITAADWNEDGYMSECLSPPYFAAEPVAQIKGSIEAAEQWIRRVSKEIDLLVVATKNSPNLLFSKINNYCLRHQLRWLRIHDDGHQTEIGPYVDPYSSACFECMLLRRRSTSEFGIEEELLQRKLAEDIDLRKGCMGEGVAQATAAAALAAQEVIRILTGISAPQTEDSVTILGHVEGIQSSRFMRVPKCTACDKGLISAVFND